MGWLGGGGGVCRATEKRRGWVGGVSMGEGAGGHLSVTHDGTAICPSGGGGEEERTLSH